MNAIAVIILLLVLAAAALIVGLFFLGKYSKKKCTDGPAFWCANPTNWALCVDNTRKHSYDDYCCKDNKTWMDKIDTKDPDPHTNGFNKHCK